MLRLQTQCLKIYCSLESYNTVLMILNHTPWWPLLAPIYKEDLILPKAMRINPHTISSSILFQAI